VVASPPVPPDFVLPICPGSGEKKRCRHRRVARFLLLALSSIHTCPPYLNPRSPPPSPPSPSRSIPVRPSRPAPPTTARSSSRPSFATSFTLLPATRAPPPPTTGGSPPPWPCASKSTPA